MGEKSAIAAVQLLKEIPKNVSFEKRHTTLHFRVIENAPSLQLSLSLSHLPLLRKCATVVRWQSLAKAKFIVFPLNTVINTDSMMAIICFMLISDMNVPNLNFLNSCKLLQNCVYYSYRHTLFNAEIVWVATYNFTP